MASSTTRVCNVCFKNKDIHEFGFKNKAMSIRAYTCKECGRIKASRRRAATREYLVQNKKENESLTHAALRLAQLPTLNELTKKCTIDNTCWLWNKSTRSGYGVYALKFGSGYAPMTIPVHRLAYYLMNERISDIGVVAQDSFVIDHLCGNRRCINPDHLEEVLQSENIRRAFDYHCPGCNCGENLTESKVVVQ